VLDLPRILFSQFVVESFTIFFHSQEDEVELEMMFAKFAVLSLAACAGVVHGQDSGKPEVLVGYSPKTDVRDQVSKKANALFDTTALFFVRCRENSHVDGGSQYTDIVVMMHGSLAVVVFTFSLSL
jgi:hypothetical protein